VKEAEAALAARQQAATEAVAAVEAAQKTVTTSNEQIAALMKEAVDYATAQQKLKEEFAVAVAGYKASLDELVKVKDQLAAVTTTKDSTVDGFDAAVKAVTEATATADAAAGQIKSLTAQQRRKLRNWRKLRTKHPLRRSCRS
jgi:flagellar biosynthesis chaperone FliJ